MSIMQERRRGHIAFGFILTAFAIGLIYWNEIRSARMDDTLSEGYYKVIPAKADQLDPNNEGKLIHLIGSAVAGGPALDPDVGIQAEALRLDRQVEMYQWHQKSLNKHGRSGTIPTGAEIVGQYAYWRAWSDKLVESDKFAVTDGHINPPAFPIEKQTILAPDIRIGSYRIGEALVKGRFKTAPFVIPQNGAFLSSQQGDYLLANNALYSGNPNEPDIGTIRISYRIVRPQTMSVIAGQENGVLLPFATETGNILWLMEPGHQSASAMLQMAEDRNVSITWGGRIFGFLMLFLGIKLVLNWMAGDIPIIGGLVHGATNVAAAIIAAVAGIAVIAISWLVSNLFVGILLLLALVAAFLGARKRQAV